MYLERVIYYEKMFYVMCARCGDIFGRMYKDGHSNYYSSTSSDVRHQAKEETKAESEAKTDTAESREVKLIGAHVNTVDSSYQAGFDAMKEKLEEVSGGKMTVEIHPNGELGRKWSRTSWEDGNRNRWYDRCFSKLRSNHRVLKKQTCSLSHSFTLALDHWTAVVDGEVGQTITDKINAGGVLHNLGYWSCGTREYFGVKPVNTVEDFKGNVKIRVQDSDVVRSVWSAPGSKTQPHWLTNELYSGLQNHVIDAKQRMILETSTAEVLRSWSLRILDWPWHCNQNVPDRS